MEILSGWKEIADHLHLGLRTAQRWERFGLPVRRVSASPCSPVVAIPEELEMWARRQFSRADAERLASHKPLVKQLHELRESNSRARRRTRKLLRRVNSLATEQIRLLSLIQSSLEPHRRPERD